MSRDNVEIVRQAYEAWNEDGPESITRFWAEDAELHDPPTLPDRRVVRGREAVLAHLTDQGKVVGAMKLTHDRGESSRTSAVTCCEWRATVHGRRERRSTFTGEIGQAWSRGWKEFQRLRKIHARRKPSKPPGLSE